jgi:hypothetical protein
MNGMNVENAVFMVFTFSSMANLAIGSMELAQFAKYSIARSRPVSFAIDDAPAANGKSCRRDSNSSYGGNRNGFKLDGEIIVFFFTI